MFLNCSYLYNDWEAFFAISSVNYCKVWLSWPSDMYLIRTRENDLGRNEHWTSELRLWIRILPRSFSFKQLIFIHFHIDLFEEFILTFFMIWVNYWYCWRLPIEYEKFNSFWFLPYWCKVCIGLACHVLLKYLWNKM